MSTVTDNARNTALALALVVEEVGNLDYLGVVGERSAVSIMALNDAIRAQGGVPGSDLDELVTLVAEMPEHVGNYPYMERIAAGGLQVSDAADYLDLLDAGTIDADATLWEAAVVAAGGTVTPARLAIISTHITTRKYLGLWDKVTDEWLFAAENAAQSLVSLKQLRSATAVNSPVFAPTTGYTFDGATNYIDTGWLARTSPGLMQVDNSRLAVWLLANVTINTTYSMGGQDSGTQGFRMGPATSGRLMQAQLSRGTVTSTRARATAIGYAAASRGVPDQTVSFFEDGRPFDVVPATATSASVLTNRSMTVGCLNNSGTMTGFRPDVTPYVAVGVQLTEKQEADDYEVNYNLLGACGVFGDPDAFAWARAVRFHGGTVSEARFNIIADFFDDLKTAGVWDLTDDMWLFLAEDQAQAFTSLKGLRLATAINSPLFVPKAGLTTGAGAGNSGYLRTGYIPGTAPCAMTIDSRRFDVREMANISSGVGIGAGTSGNNRVLVTNRVSGNQAQTQVGAQSAINSASASVPDSVCLITGQRAPGGVVTQWRDGVLLTTDPAPTLQTTIPGNFDIQVGGWNNQGAASSLRPTTFGYVAAGASLDATQHAAYAAAVAALLVAAAA